MSKVSDIGAAAARGGDGRAAHGGGRDGGGGTSPPSPRSFGDGSSGIVRARNEGYGCALDSAFFRPMVRKDEVSSSGIDEYLQNVGSDPSNTLVSTGLRIPTAPFALPSQGNIGVGRYLFQLCCVKISVGRRIMIKGLRQMLLIGFAQQPNPEIPPYVIKRKSISIGWQFPDGDVSWHLRKVKPLPRQQNRVLDTDNFRFRFSDTSSSGCLLYEQAHFPAANLDPNGRPDFYTRLDGYVPPKMLGDPIAAQLGTFRETRNNWDGTSVDLQIPVEGPCTIVFYASVRQTNPNNRPAIVFPPGGGHGGLEDEDSFVATFPAAMYWKIGGAIQYQEDGR